MTIEYMSREDYCEEYCGKENRNGYKTCHNCAMLNVPSVDVQPIRRGRWIHDSRTQWKCSNCGNFLDFDGLNCGRGSAFFCPNCGADMRGEDNGRSS